MVKGEMFTLTIKKTCLCERSHGAPHRFVTGSKWKAQYEVALRKDFHLCFYVYDLKDFVYFPRASVSWEELEEKGK